MRVSVDIGSFPQERELSCWRARQGSFATFARISNEMKFENVQTRAEFLDELWGKKGQFVLQCL